MRLSPCGRFLAFFLVDNSNVYNYPLVKMGATPQICPTPYPKAGQPSETVDLGIINTETSHVHFLKKQNWSTKKDGTGKYIHTQDNYLVATTFSPSGDCILAGELNRAQNHMTVSLFSTATGERIRTLFEENADKYLRPDINPIFVSEDCFAWVSDFDGFRHIALYDTQGKKLRQLTSGEWEVKVLKGFDKESGCIIAECNMSSPLNTDLIAVETSTGKITNLGKTQGTHQGYITAPGMCLDVFSSPTVPRTIELKEISTGRVVKTLLTAATPLAGYAVPQVETGTVEINGDPLYYRTVKPAGFDAARKYPLVCYFYGGPHVQLICNNWNRGTAGFEYMMAQAGYIVFSIDPHGSAGRGVRFEQHIWRNIGGTQVQEYVQAVKWLTQRMPCIDTKRIGVYGWSFGGFMATSLMLKAGGIFRVGVAGGPVINWENYEVMYTERYMQTPQQNPEGYRQNNLLNHVGSLEGRLMLIHCDNDDVVLWQNSLEFLKASVAAGVQVDYNVYVGHPHNVRGSERVHLMQKIKQYFDDHLL